MEENGETFIIDSKFKNPTNDRSAYSISVKNLTKSKKKKKKERKTRTSFMSGVVIKLYKGVSF